MNLIHPAERFDDALFGQFPHVAGKTRGFIHQFPVIVEYKVAKQFFTLFTHRFARVWPAAPAPKNTFDVGMTVQIFLQQTAHISLR